MPNWLRLPDGIPLDTFPMHDVVNGMLIRGGKGHKIEFWDLVTGKEVRRIPDPVSDDERPMSFLVHRGELIVDDLAAMTTIYDYQTGKVLRKYPGDPETIEMIPLGDQLATGHLDGSIALQDLATGKIVKTTAAHDRRVYLLATLGDELISVSEGNDCQVWDREMKRRVDWLQCDQKVTSIASIDGLLIFGFENGLIRVFDKDFKDTCLPLNEHKTKVISLAVGKLGGILLLFSVSSDGMVLQWDVATGELLGIPDLKEIAPRSIIYSDGKLIISNADQSILVMDFSAEDTALLEDIAIELDSDDPVNAVERFTRLPIALRRQVYDKNSEGDWMASDKETKAKSIRAFLQNKKIE